MVYAVKFVTTAYPPHGNALGSMELLSDHFLLVTTVVNAWLQQLATFVNARFHSPVATAKR